MIISQIPQWISFGKKDVSFDIHPESGNEVEDYRAAEGDERGVDKVQPYFAGSNVEFIAEIGANTKRICFNEPSESIHSTLI